MSDAPEYIAITPELRELVAKVRKERTRDLLLATYRDGPTEYAIACEKLATYVDDLVEP